MRWTRGETQLRMWGLGGPGGLLCLDGFALGTSLWPHCDTEGLEQLKHLPALSF